MEAVGLGVGIVGLAGLYTACLDAVNRVSSYRSSQADSRDLDVQFAAEKLRFERWGRQVGVTSDQESPSKTIHRETYRVVKELLRIIQNICEPNVDPSGNPSGARTTSLAQDGGSRRRKILWAMHGKKHRIEEVELLGKLIQQLYTLVPPGEEQSSLVAQGTVAKVGGSSENGRDIPPLRSFVHLITSLIRSSNLAVGDPTTGF